MNTMREALGGAFAIIVICIVVLWDLAMRLGGWFFGGRSRPQEKIPQKKDLFVSEASDREGDWG